MTHGDKKAKQGKTSQASAKKSSSKAGPIRKASGKAGPPVQSRGKEPAGAKKGGAEKDLAKGAKIPVAKAPASPAEAKGKPRPASDTGGPFANPVVAAAFKRAVKKYPNAFRRLTD